MSLRQLLSILRARWRMVVLVTFAVTAIALGWTALRKPSFVAKAPVLVDVRTDPTGATPLQGMVSPSYISTQIDIIKSQRVSERVLEILPADQQPMKRLQERAKEKNLPREWLVEALQTSLEVKPARESNIINISWTGRSPDEAARVANAFAQAYFDTNLNLKTAPAKRYTEWFDQQVAQARERLENAQKKLADYQQKAGLVSSSEQGDYERQRLAELTAQLINLQTRGRGGDATAGANNALVNTLRGEVARMEAKVTEASATLGSNHPRMQQMQAELATMRSRLGAETSRAGADVHASAQSQAARIRDIEAQIAAQKSRVLASSRERGDLNVLQQEVLSAQKAYETVAAGAAQSRLQSMTTQGNVLFLGNATQPLQPSGPPAIVLLAIAMLGGLVLGLLSALLTELGNRRVRTADDLEAVTQLPILGEIAVTKPRAAALQLAYNDSNRRLALPHGRLA